MVRHGYSWTRRTIRQKQLEVSQRRTACRPRSIYHLYDTQNESCVITVCWLIITRKMTAVTRETSLNPTRTRFSKVMSKLMSLMDTKTEGVTTGSIHDTVRILDLMIFYKECDASPLLSLHWLPVRFRILFKINLLTYKTLREKQPVYLYSMLAASIPSRSLRSNNDNSLSVPRVKTNTGARAFYSCAPSLWNNLPLSVHSASSVATFKKYLKTHLFYLAFPP